MLYRSVPRITSAVNIVAEIYAGASRAYRYELEYTEIQLAETHIVKTQSTSLFPESEPQPGPQ